MLANKLTAAMLMASALMLTACNDRNDPQGLGVITNPTNPTADPTVGSFASGQVKTLTCSNGDSVEINGTAWTDSDAVVDVEALTPGCLGGPAT